MTEFAATTQCANAECQAANPLDNKHCEKCGTPLIKRYLWALGDWIDSYEVGQLIDDRYLIKANKIVLDTKPGIPPQFSEDIPSSIKTYLKLFPYRLHLPQIYTYYSNSDETVVDSSEEISEDTLFRKSREKPEEMTAETSEETYEEIPDDTLSDISQDTLEETFEETYEEIPDDTLPDISQEILDDAFADETPPPRNSLDICLLEYGTVPLDESGEIRDPDLLPQLTEVWSASQDNPLQQLNWLWQITKLWQPLEGQQVVSSLLDPFLLRVNGGIVQLLELRKDEHSYHSVKELGQFWLSLTEGASPLIANYLRTLCDYLQRGKIRRPDHLLNYLDLALTQCGQWYEQKYQIFTQTDTGPTRDHNEDACYPEADTLIEFPNHEPHFTLVCDGIGGQDGGEIASRLAIDTLVEEIPKLSVLRETWHSHDCLQQLSQVVSLANDRISERNDEENRQHRRRMGTTIVLTLTHGHEIYTAHVGDSRIYRITPHSCHQVTVDDDLASREVNLGYLFYRDAIKYPNSGALIQALGMANSASLHPNVGRLMVDEDCIFLLCSDGLSDYDRVEQYWESEIAPIISGEQDLPTVGKRLINLANQQNGHDNVTISLVYIQIKLTEQDKTPLSMADVETALASLSEAKTTEPMPSEASPALSTTESLSKTPLPTEAPRSSPKISPLILALGGILVVCVGVWGFGIWQLLRTSKTPYPAPETEFVPSPLPELSPDNSFPEPSPSPFLESPLTEEELTNEPGLNEDFTTEER